MNWKEETVVTKTLQHQKKIKRTKSIEKSHKKTKKKKKRKIFLNTIQIRMSSFDT